MGTNLIFKPAEPKDAVELSALVNSAYRGESSKAGWTTEADLLGGQRTNSQLLLDDINSPNTVILTLRETAAGPILGCVYLEKTANDCYLGMLTVAPQLQNSGYGKALLSAAEDHARKWNCPGIIMGVIQVRKSLIEWYERRGYKKTGETRPFPYGDLNFGEPKRDDLHFIMLRKNL